MRTSKTSFQMASVINFFTLFPMSIFEKKKKKKKKKKKRLKIDMLISTGSGQVIPPQVALWLNEN